MKWERFDTSHLGYFLEAYTDDKFFQFQIHAMKSKKGADGVVVWSDEIIDYILVGSAASGASSMDFLSMHFDRVESAMAEAERRNRKYKEAK